MEEFTWISVFDIQKKLRLDFVGVHLWLLAATHGVRGRQTSVNKCRGDHFEKTVYNPIAYLVMYPYMFINLTLITLQYRFFIVYKLTPHRVYDS